MRSATVKPAILGALVLCTVLMSACTGLVPIKAVEEKGLGMRFPNVSGSNLEGREFNLPDDFEGDLTLVIVPFQRRHQDVIDVWAPHVKELAAAMPGFRFYETPTLARMNRLYRWGIDSGMRGGIPDPATRAITITLYIDKEPFRAALEIPDEETVHFLLLDGKREVIWRGTGDYTPEKYRRAAGGCERELARTQLTTSLYTEKAGTTETT